MKTLIVCLLLLALPAAADDRWPAKQSGSANSSAFPPLTASDQYEARVINQIKQGVNAASSTTYRWSTLDEGIAAYTSVIPTSAAASTCTALGNVGTVYLLNDSNGSCAGGGALYQACRCEYVGAVTWALKPANNGISYWAHRSSGADAGGGAVYNYGVADWEGPWGELAGSTAGNCAQDQYATGGRHGSPYLPVTGHTLDAFFRIGLSNLSTAQANNVPKDLDASIVVWAFVEDGNTDILIDPTGTTPGTVLQGITNGLGILFWHGIFYDFDVRAGVEIFGTAKDYSLDSARSTFANSKRGLINAIHHLELISPSTNQTSFWSFAFNAGFFPFGSDWARSFSVTDTNGFLAIPSGTPAAGYAGLVPVITSCATPVPAWGAVAYVPGQRVTNGGLTYICLIAHTGTVFATNLAEGKWQLNDGIADAFFGTMQLIPTEHGF